MKRGSHLPKTNSSKEIFLLLYFLETKQTLDNLENIFLKSKKGRKIGKSGKYFTVTTNPNGALIRRFSLI